MDLYQFADKVTSAQQLKITQSDKERIISTLRVAGILTVVTPQEEAIATKLFTAKANKLREAKQNGFFRSAAPTTDPKQKFQEIKKRKDEGICPKCNQKAATAKLRDKEDVLYCESCRATLWKD